MQRNLQMASHNRVLPAKEEKKKDGDENVHEDQSVSTVTLKSENKGRPMQRINEKTKE